MLCTDKVGNKFIIEMQNAEQEHFFERTIFYSSKLIAMTPPKGQEWNYALPPTYVIAFLNFSFSVLQGQDNNSTFTKHFKTCEVNGGEKMPGSTEFIFFSLKDFTKKEDELETYPEKWLFLLKHSESFREIPRSFKVDETFNTFFEASNRTSYSKEEELEYVKAMMNQNDIRNSKREACERAMAEGLEKGRAEGKAEGKEEIARAMKADGMPLDVIAKYSGLTEDQIKSL